MTTGKIGGRSGVSGTITMEALPHAMVHFLAASRFGSSIVESGTGPYVYTASDGSDAHLKSTLRSLTIGVDRAGIGFAYLGCQATGMRLFFEDGIPVVEYTIFGLAETNDYTPGVITDPTELPFAADEVSVDVAASTRTDIDSLEMNIDDSGSLRYNLSGQAAADYVLFGEHMGDASFEVDFESKADYAIWKARTVQELIVEFNKSVNQIVNVEFHGALYDDFEVDLTALGDQVRASTSLRSAYDVASTAATTIVLTTATQVVIT